MNENLSAQDERKIEQAIAEMERRTSGELRVVFTPHRVPDALAAAEAEFARLGMHQTRLRNAVLIYVAPASHTFAIFGDREIHARCGEPFWREVAAAMSERFRAGALADGIVLGIERAGGLLAEQFPRSAQDVNELPDQVINRGTVI